MTKATTRKRLYCKKCGFTKWALKITFSRWQCTECDSDVNFYESIRSSKEIREKNRKEKAKVLGTYQSKEAGRIKREERRRTIDRRYIWWIHGFQCVVPGCQFPHPVHAHHSTPKSQMGSDLDALPICGYHHLQELHSKFGNRRAQEEWGIDFAQLVQFFNAKYDAGEVGPYHHLIGEFIPDRRYKSS